jgi:hypothetical protein
MSVAMSDHLNRRRLLRGGAVATLIGGLAAATPAWARVGQGSSIDPTDVQILFADLQSSLVTRSVTTSPAVIAQAAKALANVASVLKMPMVFSVVPEGDGRSVLIPELQEFATSTNTFRRTPISPFHHPETVSALARSHRRTLVIAGFATEAAVEQSALDAIAAGYTVFHAIDAMGGLSQRGEDAALRTIEAAGSTPTSVLSLATRLVNDFVTPVGGQVFKAIQPLFPG